jgi:hypothetical protein
MVRAGDLFGDGVNMAARLQTLANPLGPICGYFFCEGRSSFATAILARRYPCRCVWVSVARGVAVSEEVSASDFYGGAPCPFRGRARRDPHCAMNVFHSGMLFRTGVDPDQWEGIQHLILVVEKGHVLRRRDGMKLAQLS